VSFTVTRIAPVGTPSKAFDLNDSAVVVGEVQGAFPWVFTPPGPGSQLQTFAGGTGRAWAINNNGDIVGFCEKEVFDNIQDPSSKSTGTRAVLWAQGSGAPHDLGTLIPAPSPPFPLNSFIGSSSARDINDHGRIVGESDVAIGMVHAFLVEGSTLPFFFPIDLDAFVPLAMRPVGVPIAPSSGNGINNNGEIAMTAAVDAPPHSFVARAFIIKGFPLSTSVTAFQPLPNPQGGVLANGVATSLNATPQVIGTSFDGPHPNLVAPTNWHATFFRDPPPAATLPAVIARPLAINDSGATVGSAGNPSAIAATSSERGFLLDPSAPGFLVDLTSQTPGFTVLRATGINKYGQISAIAFDMNAGIEVGVLLTP
jgi:probable HAF family extracellular repeat protein